MIKIITVPENIDFLEWSQFVYNHPYGNAFQTPEMYQVYQHTPLYEPILVVAKDNEKILGMLLAVVQKEYPSPLGFLSARSIIWGGPLVVNNDEKIIKQILHEYDSLARTKVIYSQFRNLWAQNSEKKVFEELAFTYEEHLNILVDLTKSENDLWSQMNPKRRNEIRRAIKENTFVTISGDIEEIKECYFILREVYRNAKLPLPGFEYFLNIKKYLNNQAKSFYFVAKNNADIIGCMLVLCYKNVIYDLYAGSLNNYYKKYPNDIIPWEVFKWGKQHGYTLFDFGGAGKPDVPYGVRDYKKKFGGTMVELGRFEKVHHPLLMQVAKTGFKLWQKVKFE
ncbi:lipid II:glycine glycyltransferase FemX [Melioribacter sp. OK-6-Me]|uniref:lipid II:glycine glycyltransferase FemX n=1 Tax=Melioribacter sp. OK-6-Me TaxID=3423433 RepID=UPI003ED90848